MARLCTKFFLLALSVCLTARLASGSSLRQMEHRIQELEAQVNFMADALNSTKDFKEPKVVKSCPSEFYKHLATHSCYRVMTEGKSWYDARVDCQNQGAQLVWFESMVEYRHIVIKLLTDITADKDYNNAGYWSSANDITGGNLVWGDTDMLVANFFLTTDMVSRTQRYGYQSGYSSSSSTKSTQKHCMFMQYLREKMQITQEMSECDGGRLYICKCKTDRHGQQGCTDERDLPRKPVKSVATKD